PVSNYFTVEYTLADISEVFIKVMDQVGKTCVWLINGEIQSPGFHSLDFNRPELADGIYILQIKTNTETFTGKFIISK
ncbi:MAG: T9SS type A sorting domain-containing protein, partial [Bacteroidales bacterium]|nr:T9SS type A sorting domain-containing protein [Bacteroidales bacterium]